MRSRGLVLCVLAIALPSCMRGCNPTWSCNAPAESCDQPSDCPARTTCLRGYCVDDGYARIDADCRNAPACAARGECSAIPRNSFLGLDSPLECAAVTEHDCRMSQLCRDRGQCARGRGDAGCAATDAAACRASTYCASREECDLDDGRCVRHWRQCPPLAVPGAPAWLAPARLDWDYDTLRTTWQPGDLAHATLACRVTGHGAAPTTLRIAGRCAPGPTLDRAGAGTFLHADVALHPGDAIAFAIDGPSGSAFAQLRYDGNSPMTGGSGDETIECVAVPPAVAQERARRELAAIDRDLAAAGRDHPDLDSSHGDLSGAIEDARVHSARAALWLGWNGAELALRVVRLDTAAAAWRAALDAAIRKVVATDKPVRGDHVTLTRAGLVCGDALRARVPAASDCALELAIDNTGPTAIALAPGRDTVAELDALMWLRPGDATQPTEVARAVIIAARAGATEVTTGELALAPGQRGIVLIAGATSGALLRGRLDLRTTFALRP